MDASSVESPLAGGQKRKRTTPGVEEGRQPHSGGNVTQINYLVRSRADRLRLMEGDSETFGDILEMIDDYEGILQRHESLAANLGAKLVGPLLLKSFEKLFDGPIKVITSSFGLEQSQVSWLDIVTFARTNSTDFVLHAGPHGTSTCRFWIKGGQVEISEDDYRLIMSGGPERMIPTQAIPEDETAELGTLNILETRLAILIKKADAVASKARQLNYHLKGRKTAVFARKAAASGNSESETPSFLSQPFSAINSRQAVNSDAAKVQQNLLEQFTANDRRQSLPHSRPKTNRLSTNDTAIFQTADHGQDNDTRRLSQPLTSSEDGTEGQYRMLMASKMEKINRGDPVYPPCDRCRRLKFDCTKHLTACQACTKKHAKCSWKDIKEGELDNLPHVSSEGRHGSAALDGNLDPGMAAGSSSISVPAQPHAHPVMIQNSGTDGSGGGSRMSTENALLTQMASAAASVSSA